MIIILTAIHQLLNRIKEQPIQDQRIKYSLYLTTWSASLDLILSFVKGWYETDKEVNSQLETLISHVQKDIHELTGWINSCHSNKDVPMTGYKL